MPILMPSVIAKVMHKPGVRETRKKVGIKTMSTAKSGILA
jgi:hypothetical protein